MLLFNQYRKIKLLTLIILFSIFLVNSNLIAENIYFSTRSTFADSQFWERDQFYTDKNNTRKAFANLFSGSIGLGFEMVIWDIEKKRGSRIYFKGGLDLVFSGLNYVGAFNDQGSNDFTLYTLNNSGAFFTGLDWDIYFGGTFPKTDLIWGFGCMFTFLFPSYAPGYDVRNFVEKFSFYAAPTILLGYDIFIPNTNFKITPQTRLGFTCMPLIPDDLVGDYSTTGGKYHVIEYYSGIYIDLSVAFSFYSIKWK